MNEYIYLLISLVALFFSYLFTLIENAYLALGPVKLSKLEDCLLYTSDAADE
mgnify:CR=1 FL=1